MDDQQIFLLSQLTLCLLVFTSACVYNLVKNYRMTRAQWQSDLPGEEEVLRACQTELLAAEAGQPRQNFAQDYFWFAELSERKYLALCSRLKLQPKVVGTVIAYQQAARGGQ